MASGFEFSDVVEEAVDRSGGQEVTASEIQKIRRGLRILTERWQAQGYNTWRIRQYHSAATGVAAPIQLPDTLDDIIQVNTQRGRGSAETALRRISPIEYAQLATKDTKGQPSQYYLDRKEPPEVYVYPVGDPSYHHGVTIWYVERPEEFERYGESTDDVPSRWLEALVSGLALDLARKRPPYNEALIARLKGEAAEAEDLAQRADRGRQRYRYRNSYMR